MRIPEPLPVPAASEFVMSMGEPCSTAAVVSIVGERQTLLVLREAFSSVMRSDESLCHTGCSSTALSSRFKMLVIYGILRHVPYQESGGHVRDICRLTWTGMDLLSAIVVFMQWGDRYLTPDGESPILLRDRGSDTLIHITLVNALGELVTLKNSMRERNPCHGRRESRAIAAADASPANG